jgi:hypothetical protein
MPSNTSGCGKPDFNLTMVPQSGGPMSITGPGVPDFKFTLEASTDFAAVGGPADEPVTPFLCRRCGRSVPELLLSCCPGKVNRGTAVALAIHKSAIGF